MHDDHTPPRRRFIASALGLAGAAAVARVLGPVAFGTDGALQAFHPAGELSGPATVDSPAVRVGPAPVTIELPPDGKVAFPIDPGDRCFVLDNYGDCRGGGSRAHEGVDILAAKGQAVYAVCDGTVVGSYVLDGSAGNGWSILSDDGVRYAYLHLDTMAEGLRVGSRVAFGDVIGTVGSTGTGTTTNNHLHFEVRPVSEQAPRGTPIDPFPLLVIPPQVTVYSDPATLQECRFLL